MKINFKTQVLLFSVIAAISGCIEPYALEGISGDPDFLVVDGFIDATHSSATVKLSKAVPLESTGKHPAVSNASISLESSTGEEFFLQEVDPEANPGHDSGSYHVSDLTLDLSKQYRLKIALSSGSGKQYVSDFITIQKAAPIESVVYRPDEEDVKIFVNSTESGESSNFYRWRYQEAFEYNSPLFSSWYMNADRVMTFRDASEHVYICYQSDPSYEILIGSSQDLGANVIRNYLIKSIPRTSLQITRTYSINVQQLGLTEDAYAYWLNLYKTTESTGGLFDPMPGQVTGNIRSVNDPTEVVIGFFSGSTVEEKRIFFSRSDLPHQYTRYRYPFCEIDTVMIPDLEFISPNTIFANAIYDEMGFTIIGYTRSSPTCLDCRNFRKGTTTKPDYWP